MWLAQPELESSLHIGERPSSQTLAESGWQLLNLPCCTFLNLIAVENIPSAWLKKLFDSGEQNLREVVQFDPFLHLKLAYSDEGKTPGWSDRQWGKGLINDMNNEVSIDLCFHCWGVWINHSEIWLRHSPPKNIIWMKIIHYFVPGREWPIQRLGRRHRGGQHLLWRGNCHGFDHNNHLNQMVFKLLLPPELERQIRMSPIEFLSSLGGLFGLCLGFSIASFFEIIYWFTIVLSRFLLKLIFLFSFYNCLMFRNVGRSVRK